MMTNRREFISTVLGSSAVVSLSGLAPDVFYQAALADEAKKDGRVLVVVQLSGGNDGLNTVVPYRHDVYRENRKALRVSKDDVLTLDKEYGLHPAMDGFAKLFEKGLLGIVPSVGYDQPNRSHFESMASGIRVGAKRIGFSRDGWGSFWKRQTTVHNN